MANKRKELNITGANLWYLVGLITSDGCLSTDGRHIDITSKDYEYLDKIKNTLQLTNKIGIKYNTVKQKSFHIQIANMNFYNFLITIGLSPHKSLTLGRIKVSNAYFVDFLRGVIDGDGCIRKWTHPSNKREQWSLRIYSGSGEFINWLNTSVKLFLKVSGKIHNNDNTRHVWVLKYGKMAGKEIVKQCYYKNCLGLERKIKLAQECRLSYAGWKQSKTVFN